MTRAEEHRHISPSYRALALLCALLLPVAAPRAAGAPMQLTVIPLQHRTAQEVLPLLRPFLDPHGALAGTDHRLVIRTSSRNLKQLRTILAKLDTAPRLLLVSVRRAAYPAATSGVRVVGETGAQGGLTVRSPPRNENGSGSGGRHVRVYATRDEAAQEGTRQLRVLEGRAAYIETGESVPVLDDSITVLGGQAQVLSGVRYRDVTTGFRVVAWVSGRHVTLEVAPHHDEPSAHGGGAIHIQRLATTVSGTLGEWIDIGGTGRLQEHHGRGTVYGTETLGEARGRILVRVELARPRHAPSERQ